MYVTGKFHEDIHFVGSLSYPVLYKKNICILRKEKLINS
jgi:hypothetical protein